MAIIRQLKDTFQYTHSYEEIRSQQRIMGRRILSTKKLLCLPFDQGWSMNFNEISHSYHQYDVKQSKLKNILIDELKTFFISRNQNYRQQDSNRNTPILTKSLLLVNFFKANTSLVASISFITNIFFRNAFIPSSKKFFSISNFLTDTIFYSTSFTFGCIGVQYFKQRKFPSIHHFSSIFTRSLLLHTCLTLFTGINSPTQRTLSIPLIRPDIFIRIITSILHLIVAFMINFKNNDIL